MKPAMVVFSGLVYVCIILVFVDAIRYRAEVKKYTRLGVLFGLGLLMLDILVLVLLGPSVSNGQTSCMFLLVVDGFVFCKTAVVAAVGIHCCVKLGLPSAPLTMQLLRFQPAGPDAPIGDSEGAADDEPLAGNPVEPPAEPLPTAEVHREDQYDWKQAAFWSLLVAGLAVAYSYVLFTLTSPSMSETMREALGDSDTGWTVLSLAILSEFAFGEEVLFRLGIQNLIAKSFRLDGPRYWWAIVISTTIWSFGHANVLTPEWVKLVQIIPAGIAFGYLFRKFGVEACIVSHVAFNIVMGMIGQHLIS